MPEGGINLRGVAWRRRSHLPERLETIGNQSGVAAAGQVDRFENLLRQSPALLGKRQGELPDLRRIERREPDRLGTGEEAGAQHVAKKENADAPRRQDCQLREVSACGFQVVEKVLAG